MRSVTFITHDGYRLPTARIRCYRFADELSRRGYATKVISTVDHLGAKFDGDQRWRISDIRKLIINNSLLQCIEEDPKCILYMQKIDYHFLSILLAKKLYKHPLILDYDDFDLHVLPFKYFKFIPGDPVARLTRYICENAEARVVSSHFLKEMFDEWRPGTKIIHTGVDSERFNRANVPEIVRSDDRIIFSWSGIIWGEPILQCVEFVFKCFKNIKNRGKVILRIQGGGVLWKSLEKMARNLSDSVQIELLGWSHPDEMPARIAQIDVGLLPLPQNSLFNRAKSPTKLFEYMAMGKPTICSRIGEACHVINDGQSGYLVSGADEWICAIDNIVDNPDLIEQVGARARESVLKNYSLKSLGAELEKVVLDVSA